MAHETTSEIVRYNYRLRPGVTAERALLSEWDRVRWVWNNCVGRAAELLAEGDKVPSGQKMCSELTDWRGRKEWLAAGSQNAQANMVLTWGRARQHAFDVKGRRHPKFKSRHTALSSLEYTVNGFKLKGNRLVLAGGIVLPVVWHRGLPSEPTSVMVNRDACGYWTASFVVTRDTPEWPAAVGHVGIDWGVKVTATATEPRFDLAHAQQGRKAAAKLAKCQQKMARRKRPKGQANSAGYGRAKQETAKAYAKVARQRQHNARQWARAVVAGNDLIAVEDFKPKFLARSTMAKKAADAAIGACKTELVRYGRQAGRRVVLVPPAHTTMTCSECGARTKRLLLSERVFVCPHCGLVADRDRNAAKTILVWAEISPRGVDDVRHGPPSRLVRSELQSPVR